MQIGSVVNNAAQLLDARTADDLLRKLESISQQLGFERCLIGLQVARPMLPSTTHISSAYPLAWQQKYRDNHYIAIDPTVSHCLTSAQPIIWNEAVFQGPSHDFWEEAKSFGLAYGMSFPVHDMHGQISMLSLVRDKALDDEAELDSMFNASRIIANCAHLTLSRIITEQYQTAEVPRLTSREKQCIHWAARGKTAVEIGMILGISEATAVLHLNNTVRKLGVANRMQAVAVAVAQGLVD
jgi:DNA-binding CsgD family transcriptional regulator